MQSNSGQITALGLMSGTSMDAVDAALLTATIVNGKPVLTELGSSVHIPIEPTLRQQTAALLGSTTPSPASNDVEQKFGALFHDAVTRCLAKQQISPSQVDLIGLHGQTITHRPHDHFTWQLGDPAELARKSQIPVVHNFRQQDIERGGEGAPLAPAFHQALADCGLFGPLPVAVVNIGGISNVSIIGEHDLIAYDCGPGSGAIDQYCQQNLNIDFDPAGIHARQGRPDSDRIEAKFQEDFYQRTPPKSLDRSDCSPDWVAGLEPNDALATLTAFTSISIARSIANEIDRSFPIEHVILSGGGCYNITMREMIVAELARLGKTCLVSDIGWLDFKGQLLSGDAIEAWAFAWLAILQRCRQPASFPKTTGVPTPQVCGEYTPFERQKTDAVVS